MGRNKQMGAIANIVVGIIGAFLGGWLFGLFGAQGVTGFNLPSLWRDLTSRSPALCDRLDPPLIGARLA